MSRWKKDLVIRTTEQDNLTLEVVTTPFKLLVRQFTNEDLLLEDIKLRITPVNMDPPMTKNKRTHIETHSVGIDSAYDLVHTVNRDDYVRGLGQDAALTYEEMATAVFMMGLDQEGIMEGDKVRVPSNKGIVGVYSDRPLLTGYEVAVVANAIPNAAIHVFSPGTTNIEQEIQMSEPGDVSDRITWHDNAVDYITPHAALVLGGSTYQHPESTRNALNRIIDEDGTVCESHIVKNILESQRETKLYELGKELESMLYRNLD